MIRGGLVTLPVREVAQAVRFYVETLGMKLIVDSPELAIFDAGEGFHIALRARGGEPASAAGGSSYPAVTLTTKLPFDETIAILENRGVSFTNKSASDGGAASFRDPDGNLLHLRPTSVIDTASAS